VKSLGKPVVIGIHEYSPICPTAILYNYASKTVCENRNLLSCLKCITLHENEKKRSLSEKFLSPLMNITLGQLYGKLLSEADAIAFVSKYQRDVIVEHMPHILDKSYVIYNPVPEVETDKVEGQDYGFYGGTSFLKGLHVLLEGLQRLGKPVKIHITGRTDKRLRINSPLLIYHGWLAPQTYQELIKRTIVTIFPSIWPEPSPYVVVESMLLGKVVIASAIGGVPEITKGAPGVFFFPAEDSSSLAERIEQVESMSKDALFELGQRNKDFARRRFRNDETIDEFVRILNRVVD
jgi:glycosyltransferase involved in cell wall biosynthesis